MSRNGNAKKTNTAHDCINTTYAAAKTDTYWANSTHLDHKNIYYPKQETELYSTRETYLHHIRRPYRDHIASEKTRDMDMNHNMYMDMDGNVADFNMDEFHVDEFNFDPFTDFGFPDPNSGVIFPEVQYSSITPRPGDMLHGMPASGPLMPAWDPRMQQAPQPQEFQAQSAGPALPNEPAANESVHPDPEKDDGRKECPHCHGRFKDLNRHLAQQACTGKNPTFSCPHPDCAASGTTFRWQKDLERHQKSQHSGQKFDCRYAGCEKSYNRADNCRRHELSCRYKPQ